MTDGDNDSIYIMHNIYELSRVGMHRHNGLVKHHQKKMTIVVCVFMKKLCLVTLLCHSFLLFAYVYE